MNDQNDPKVVVPKPWDSLKQFTPARIALGRAGISLPTRASLDFQLAHALARDAVHMPVDFAELEQRLHCMGYQTVTLKTRAENQQMYLQRPDLGRLLSEAEHYLVRLCIVLIGKRPGLSSPDSMGIYFTNQARSKISTDADRNCISNIHRNGLSYEQALKKLLFYSLGPKNYNFRVSI